MLMAENEEEARKTSCQLPPSPDLRPSRRSIVFGTPYLVGVGLIGVNAARCAQSITDALRSSRFPSLAAAIETWSKTGGTLIIDNDYNETLPITMSCQGNLSYHLSTDGVRSLVYNGPQYHWFFCIYSAGYNPFSIDGQLTIDGNNNCSMPLFVRFEAAEGSARREFNAEGLTAINARMKQGVSRVDGSRTNAYGAAGMMFTGGFDSLTLRHVRVANVTREERAGRPGSQGCIGIGVVAKLGTTRSARQLTIEDFEVRHVDSDDLPGSPERADMDGVLVFQSAERAGTRPIIQRGLIREAAGRAIKVYAPGGGGVTRDIEIHRSVPGTTTGSNDVAHQHGDGTIENIKLYYSGNAHAYPTIPVGMSAGHLRDPDFPFQPGIVRNIQIIDTTGRPKFTLLSIVFNLEDRGLRRYALSDIDDSGSAETLFQPGALGTYQGALIDINNVTVNLTRGLMATEDHDRRLEIRARSLVNRNARAVPLKTFYDGRPAPPEHGGMLVADQTVKGIAH